MDIKPETPPTVRGERAGATAAPDPDPNPAPAATAERAPAAEPDGAAVPDGAAPVPAPARRGRLLAVLLALTLGITVADQLTKYLAETRLEPGSVTPVLGDLFGFQLVYNPGAAFSLATGMTWIFTLVSVVVVVVVLRVARKLGSLGWATALGMLLGGCLGNLIDRLFRDPGFARGHVVDFLNYGGYFVGNVADIAIVGAAILIGILALRGREIDGTLAEHGETKTGARSRAASGAQAGAPEAHDA